MAFTNFQTKEINCKIVYFGPSGAGKRTNLRSILKNTSADLQNDLFELDQSGSEEKYFSFLPLSIGKVNGFNLNLHLFTLPEKKSFETVGQVILKGIDGYVFVADSQIESLADNIESLREAKRLLVNQGSKPSNMPVVFQYNKRDSKTAVPLEILKKELNPKHAPEFDAVAINSQGTLETLQAVAQQIVDQLQP